MSDINASALGETPDAEFEKQINACQSADEIKVLMAARSVSLGLTTRDIFSPDVLIPVAPATNPSAYMKRISVNGKEHLISGATEQELLAAENKFFREQFAEPAATATARNAATGRFVSQADADAKAAEELMRRTELELRFKRGEVSTSEYLAQSGAMDEYLASRGIDVHAARDKEVAQSWENATAQFLQAHPDWEGGAPALEEIGRTMERLGLVDSPTLASLETAYEDMRRRNAVPKNPEIELHRSIESARTPEELRAALNRPSSTLWR